MFRSIRSLYHRFLEKYPTKNAEGLDIPTSVNILIVGQIIIIFLIHLLFIGSRSIEYSLDSGFNQFFFLMLVFAFSSYYRAKAINAGRGVVIYNTGEFIVLSSIVLFNSILLTLITISLHIFSHFLFGLRNPHQLIFNFANEILSGSIVFYCYTLFGRELIMTSEDNLIVGTYILTLIYYLLNNIQTLMVVSLVSATSVFSILEHNYKAREELYMVVVSATATLFTIIVPNLYPVFYILIFMLFIQHISKEQEAFEKNEAKLKLQELQHKSEIQDLKVQELEKLKIFAGKVAHDIRNYITIINANIQFIDEDLENIFINQMRMASDDIEDIIGYLSDFSVGDKLHLEEVEINSFIEEIVYLNSPKSDYTYQFERFDKMIMVEIDRIKMKQVVSNIIINAKEAIDHDKGKIVVGIDVEDDQEKVVIRIEDNGYGIPEEDQDKIFKPFFSTKNRGSGLGITLAESIILAHHGILRFESQYQEGTEFFISLPIKRIEND